MLLVKTLKLFNLTQVLQIFSEKSGIEFCVDTVVHHFILVMLVCDDKSSFAIAFVTFFKVKMK